MHNPTGNTISLDLETAPHLPAGRTTSDYAIILDKFSISYELSGYYWQAGQINASNGWALYLSSITIQIHRLLETVIPVLAAENVPFKIVRDSQVADWMLDGQLGSHNLGKIICVYPIDKRQLLDLAKTLTANTDGFKGPAVPLATWLGSIVYASYEISNLNDKNKTLQEINWPFPELTPPANRSNKKLLNFKYYPVSVLKNDAKGDVIRALYFKHFYQIRSCLIKQGRQNMFSDQYGRDIQDRLQWQYDLYHRLAADIPLPKVIDYFHENGDAFLVMDFLNATSFSDIISSTFKEGPWSDLFPASQVKLLSYFLRIIDIIIILHKRKFIHRDITPTNFLITKKGAIYLIDLELMWNSAAQSPSAPFTLGTYGFMSPEQFKSETPTYKEDIYAIGSLLLQLFTNLQPLKFNLWYSGIALNNIYFFTQNKMIADVIKSCLEINANDRPELEFIKTAVESYRDQISNKFSFISAQRSGSGDLVSKPEVRRIIQAGINGLADRTFLSADNLWLSTPPQKADLFGNENCETMISPGWYRGIAGPIWLLSIANKLGFNTQDCMVPYAQALGHIMQLSQNNSDTPSSLYGGLAGAAIALSETIETEKTGAEFEKLEFSHFFGKNIAQLDIASGIAGQGLALLKLQDFVDLNVITEFLNYSIESIIKQQRSDGSWGLIGSNKKEDFSFNTGATGIIWFLLNYVEKYADKVAEDTTIRGLIYLLKKTFRNNRPSDSWATINDDQYCNRWGVSLGIPGMVLTLIKAYEVIGDEMYKEIAENYLYSLPKNPVLSNFSLSNGLAGIGELYLEAAKVFQNRAWQDRANWILKVFLHTFQHKTARTGIWAVRISSTQTADLFSGNSGVIHFLLRHFAPDKTAHVLAGIRSA